MGLFGKKDALDFDPSVLADDEKWKTFKRRIEVTVGATRYLAYTKNIGMPANYDTAMIVLGMVMSAPMFALVGYLGGIIMPLEKLSFPIMMGGMVALMTFEMMAMAFLLKRMSGGD